MAGTVVADNIQAASTSTLVLKNGVASTPPTIQDSAGTQIGTFCRAWVNFNGTGTVAVNGSFNVTSITDNGTGDYTVNFTTAMPDANYTFSGCGSASSTVATGQRAQVNLIQPINTSSSQAQIATYNSGTGLIDYAIVNVAIFR